MTLWILWNGVNKVPKVRLMLDADVHDDYDEDEQSIKVMLMLMMKIGRKHFPC